VSPIVLAAATFAMGGLQAQTVGGPAVAAPSLDAATLRARLVNVMDPAGRALPADAANLDRMVREREFIKLVDRLHATRDPAGIVLDFNWEQARVFQGAGFLVVYAYLDGLWRAGNALPGDSGEGLKGTAAMMLLYDASLIAVDGTRCADPSAPEHRRDQLFAQNRPLLDYLRGLPVAARMNYGSIALDIESATAGVRQPDYVLCSGGLDEIGAGLAAQGKRPLRQMPNAPASIGKTYAVPAAPGFVPKFVEAKIWQPKQVAARQALPAELTRLLTTAVDTQQGVPAK